MTRPAPPSDPTNRPTIHRSEIAIAILFLVTAAAAITGGMILEAVFEDPADLARIAAGRSAIAAGAALWTLNNVGFVFIALFAYPVLHPVAPLMAQAYVATRVIESGVMMIGVMALVTIPGLALVSTNTAEVALLHEVSAVTLDAGMLPLLGFSGLFFTWPLYRHRLLPAWLAGLGVLAYVLTTLAGFLAWFGLVEIGPNDTGFLMVVPVATWEIVAMPIWLLWKGFSRPA